MKKSMEIRQEELRILEEILRLTEEGHLVWTEGTEDLPSATIGAPTKTVEAYYATALGKELKIRKGSSPCYEPLLFIGSGYAFAKGNTYGDIVVSCPVRDLWKLLSGSLSYSPALLTRYQFLQRLEHLGKFEEKESAPEEETPPKKYTAIKLKGMPYWLWFISEKVKREDGYITGTNGWDNSGHAVDVHVEESSIEGILDADELGYN